MKTLKRRYKEGKTDYGKRLKLLKGNSPRIVFRKTNKYIISEYITSKHAQDKVEISITSKKLMNYGWPEEFKGSLKSIPAAYLTGLLIGKRISKLKNKNHIIDIGMIRNIHKSKIYAFANGILDSGIKININKKVFPSEDRIKGKHLKSNFEKTFQLIKSKIEKE